MLILIIKLGATGDVVRTTPLLRALRGQIIWITDPKNLVLLENIEQKLRPVSWEERESVLSAHYDLAINLEDTLEVAQFLQRVRCDRVFGAHLSPVGALSYTDDSRAWFDLSLISAYGKEEADRLKLRNRRTYQEMIFAGLGFPFAGEPYLLPNLTETGLSGDVAIAAEAGLVWPMKKWAYYEELKQSLENCGLVVNILPKRPSLLDHLADVRNHHCLVGADSLPMHLALGTGTRCISLFTCTSPWEIYDYGIQTKIVSPLLEEFFYQRGYDERATTAIDPQEVLEAVMAQLDAVSSPANRQALS
jgi:heptosyltransferase-2